ncbi:MAG: hypothetical protein LBE84_08385 [Planctomycetota bacterium]|jgi:septum formation topological specificity factor MinE|nr:hypothetical protein [Planctomycetota bacterium]
MEREKTINVGIGFVTGRKNFRKVLRTYVYRWKQTGAAIRKRARLHLFVAYDLEYSNTQVDDYVNIRQDILDVLDSALFIGKSKIHNETISLAQQRVVSLPEAELLFEKGYAGKRNAVLYHAIRQKMDCLIFMDDDEYPLAVIKTGGAPWWCGQDVFASHLKYLAEADITNGYHCGYISPVPYIDFLETFSEDDFRLFIKAISNDILEWDTIRRVMEKGGVTYADPQVFADNAAREVPEVNRTKFISGSNLGINLKEPERVLPFFNPPRARGEDTFLSTCLSDRKVLRIPCYTFHDGFSVYSDLLEGVLPLELKRIHAKNESTVNRFYRACLGWVRYKPLYSFITNPDGYEVQAAKNRERLKTILPKFCTYFQNDSFMKILAEYNHYHNNVKVHRRLFQENLRIWENVREYAVGQSF